ncbi:tRNA glutamyl-Q(34) synthetase GluQRS [Yoonia litorea]|uniref:Glutamyl-Q tRNA(Asp) synthetase n=1 Tax=Yoonia litorea TaxID=1123755 RepID=A0A1I6M565_9RHOB|nr:tRNA glutamyl-Q(34) synthetase GluQRS [Yoonia litorea]SFS10865.1 glutamyl-Q tRNA(Asp) synthetase [Yoonia litorea]
MKTRFAPSPTGPLHLGHAFSALTVWSHAQSLGGVALLRIEDTDSTRCKPEFEAAIFDDLKWLGLKWPEPVLRQSEHDDEYIAVLGKLAAKGLLYPCSCSRKDIIAAGARPGEDGFVYPGTCRKRPLGQRKPGDAIRLNVAKALSRIDDEMRYEETGAKAGLYRASVNMLTKRIGDPVLQRKETGDPAYHLACVHDDMRQEITHVVRGTDLQAFTPLHVLLQTLLGYRTPIYHHHGLILDEDGRRLAKIDKSKAISKYRAEGFSRSDIRTMIGFR